MTKKGAIHESRLAVAITIKRADVESKLKTENGVKVLYDGTLLKAKNSKDFRKDGLLAEVCETSDNVGGVLLNTVEFKEGVQQVSAAVMLEGVIYGDKVENFDKTKLPATITYLFKNRK